jgi:membrane associated rhomboid family serine protease
MNERPTMCRSCGSIVGGGEAQCAVCGASVSATAKSTQTRPVADNETLRFARAILNRPYKFTIVLLVANLFAFVLMLQASNTPLSLTTPLSFEVLVSFGAKVNYLIQQHHQWWRFVTPIFLHVNLLHLMVNMYSLWMVGPYVEKLYGSAKFVFFWVVTGIAGVVASYFTVKPGVVLGPVTGFIFKGVDTPSAGASGALFGLVGVLFVFGIKFRRELPEGFKRAFGTGLLPMIFLNLFIGYVLRGFIDNAAHLGGLCAGALLALMVGYRRPGEDRTATGNIWRVVQFAALALVVVAFFKTSQHFRDPLPITVVARAAEVQQEQPQNPAYLYYAKAMSDAHEAFVAAVENKNPGYIEPAIKNLDAAPHLEARADELRDQLKALLLRAKEIAESTAGAGSAGKEKARLLTNDFAAWRKEYNLWLKSGAKHYGGLEDIVN